MSAVVQDKGYIAAAGLVISGAAALMGYRKVAATGALASVIFGGYGYWKACGPAKAIAGRIDRILKIKPARSKNSGLSRFLSVESGKREVIRLHYAKGVPTFLGRKWTGFNDAKRNQVYDHVKKMRESALKLWTGDVDGIIERFEDNNQQVKVPDDFVRDVIVASFKRATQGRNGKEAMLDRYLAGLKIVHRVDRAENIITRYEVLPTLGKKSGKLFDQMFSLWRASKSVTPIIEKFLAEEDHVRRDELSYVVTEVLVRHIRSKHPQTTRLSAQNALEQFPTYAQKWKQNAGIPLDDVLEHVKDKLVERAVSFWADHLEAAMLLLKTKPATDPLVPVIQLAILRDEVLKPLHWTINGKHHLIGTAWMSPLAVLRDEDLPRVVQGSQKTYFENVAEDYVKLQNEEENKGDGTVLRSLLLRDAKGKDRKAHRINPNGHPNTVHGPWPAQAYQQALSANQRVRLIYAAHQKSGKLLREIVSEMPEAHKKKMAAREKEIMGASMIKELKTSADTICIVVDALHTIGLIKAFKAAGLKVKAAK